MAGRTDTAASFATAVLTGLTAATGNQYPVTAANIAWIESWVNREGGGGKNNPLNTTYATDTSTLLKGNSSGVRNYASLDDGVAATVATLNNNRYANILSALRSGNAQQADQQGLLANDLLTWSGGITNGQPNGKGYSSVANVTATPGKQVGSGDGTQQSFASWLAANEPGLEGLATDPQVGPLLEQFYTNGASWADQFADQLHQTTWWQNTPADQRQSMVDAAQDPATLAQGLSNKQNYIQTEAQNLGVTMSPAQVDALAQQWQDNIGGPGDTGMSADQIRQAIVANLKGATSGQAAVNAQQIQQLYDSYGVDVSPQTLQATLGKVLANSDPTSALNAVQAQVANQAKTLWGSNPQLVQAITDGQTTAQYAEPYFEHAATLLGQSVGNMSIKAPMWQAVLKSATDPKSGQPTNQAMSIDQWDQQLRTNPIYGYDSSANAIQSASQLATGLAKTLGFGGVS